MKKDIHPNYTQDAVIKCACGNSIKVGSTKQKMEIEICSACHPFYTGKKKLVDSAGQVDRFKKRMEKATALKKSATDKKAKQAARAEAKTTKKTEAKKASAKKTKTGK